MSSQETSSNRSGTAQPLQSTPSLSLSRQSHFRVRPTAGRLSLVKPYPAEASGDGATACVTHPPRPLSSWMVPLITAGAHLNPSFQRPHTSSSSCSVPGKTSLSLNASRLQAHDFPTSRNGLVQILKLNLLELH